MPEEYDISVGSFFYDLLYPVAEQIYLLQKRISRLSENTFAVTAEGEYLDRKTAEQNIVRKTATYSKGTPVSYTHLDVYKRQYDHILR